MRRPRHIVRLLGLLTCLVSLLTLVACAPDTTGTQEQDQNQQANNNDADAWDFEEDTNTDNQGGDANQSANQTNNNQSANQTDNQSANQTNNQTNQTNNNQTNQTNNNQTNQTNNNQTNNGGESIYQGSGDPYTPGDLAVARQTIDDAPAPLLVVAPTDAGTYPLVVFQHGFLMANTHYGDLFEHLASHGFVVVAPQMYEAGGLPFGKPGTDEEAALATEIYDWLPGELAAYLDVGVAGDAPGFAGHSRGAKALWWSLRDDPRAVGAVAGVDPVDGTGGPLGGEERILDNPPTIDAPKLFIGTGLGPVEQSILEPACAPEGDNYIAFYDAAQAPATEVVAPDYGHLDMLDDDPDNCGLECDACAEGDSREPMRRLTAGLLVAHFRSALQNDPDASDYLTDASAAPVTIENRSK